MSLTIIPETAFAYLLVFARLGTMIMALPAFGDASVPARIRLAFALALSLVMLPLVRPLLPALPGNLLGLLAALLPEMLVGLFIGLTARMIMAALSVAGTTIAFQTSLGFVQNVDPSQGIQAALFSSFMTLLATTLILLLDLHHLLIAAAYDSYALFTPGQLLPLGDVARIAVETLAGAFRLGIQIAAPFLVFGLLFYMGMGVLSRLMPQVQIFFLGIPANIMLGFLLMLLLLSSMMMWFLQHFESTMSVFLR